MTALLALLLAPPVAAASYDPKLTWQTLETEHFTVTFHDGEEQLAREMAVDAEHAWSKLVPELGTEPRRKIDVVLVDWTDSANGYATLSPQNHIVIFVTAPEGDSTLGLYRDWNEAIITHELTHILHLSTVEGLPKVVRSLFGTYISTHQIEPRWIVEGFATYEETRHTTGGRGRSATVDMVKRTAVLEGNFPALGNMDGFQALPPGGNLRYLFGQDFIQFIADRAGPEAWPEWLHKYGRSIPFFYHFRHTLGAEAGEDDRKDDLGFQALYQEWKAAFRARYEDQAARIASEPLTAYQVVSPVDNSCGGPAWRPDGQQLAYACSDPKRGSDILVSRPDGTERTVLLKNKAASELAWRSDGKAIVWSQAHNVDLYSSTNDIYLYDTEKKKTKALTSGSRARDPEFSADGSKLLVVTNKVQDTQLAVVTVDGRVTPLTDLHDHTNFGWPKFSPDGAHIAVSVWQDGQRDLWLYTADGKPERRLTFDQALDIDPAWSADGRYLYFASDRSGVPNVYAIDWRDESLHRVTNVVTGAYGASPNPDNSKLALQVYTTMGAQVAVMDVTPTAWKNLGPLPRWAVDARSPGVPEGAVPIPLGPKPEGWTGPGAPAPDGDPWGAPGAADPGAAPTRAADPRAAPTTAPVDAAPSEADPWGTATPVTPAVLPPPTALPPAPLATIPLGPPTGDPPPLARRDDLPAKPYNPLPTLFPPHLWYPSLYLTSTGESFGLLGAAATYGTDLLNQYAYSGYLTYRTDARFLGGGASLTVNRWRPVVSASFSDLVTPYGDIYRYTQPPRGGGAHVPGIESTLTRYWDHRLRGAASMRYPLSEYASVYAYYSGTFRGSLDPLPDDTYFPAIATRGFFSTLGAGWARSKGEAYSLSISPEKARSLAVGLELTPSALGSFTYDDENQKVAFDQLQATAEWREYRTAPWLANHVFAWKLAGGATIGDRFRYGSFRLGGSFSENGITVVPSEWRTLRGYYPASDSGEWYWLGSGEYRFPIWNIDRGVGTIPLFARFISGTVFVDAGNAFDDPTGASLGNTLLGMGAELDVYFLYLYGAGMYARLGYGFSPLGDGIPFGSVNGAYLSLGSSF